MYNFREFVIGSGGDYSDIASFDAAFTNALIQHPESVVQARLKAETFDEWGASITIPTNCRMFHLTADDEWHKGDKTQGPTIKAVSSGAQTGLSINADNSGFTNNVCVDKIVLDGNSNVGAVSPVYALAFGSSLQTTNPLDTVADKLLVTFGTNPCRGVRAIASGARPFSVFNSLIYDAICTGVAGSLFSYGIGGDEKVFAMFNTIHGLSYVNANPNYPMTAISTTTSGVTTNVHRFWGNIGAGLAGNGTDLEVYDLSTTAAAANFEYNVADDATGNILSSVAAEFENAASGDFRLKTGAAAAGVVPGRALARNGFKHHGFLELDRDITGQLRAGTNWDAGCYNTQGGYASEPDTGSGGGGSGPVHPLRSN